MASQNYQRAITVSGSAQNAFANISRVADWWASDFTGSSRKPQDSFTVRFGDVWVTFRVIEVTPNRKIVWQVTDCHLSWLEDKSEWKDTRLVWNVSEADGGTRIEFTHEGLVPEMECFKDCSIGWDSYIQKSLFKLATEGKGLPDGF